MRGDVNVAEVFSSIQGEAKYVGTRQLFVRFCGCNLRCAYCDTKEAFSPPPEARVEERAGARRFLHLRNPVSFKTLADEMNRLLREAPHRLIGFTGGEPLLSSEAIHALRGSVAGKFFLETNGTLPERLALVLPDLDVVSMDIKTPDVAGRPYWQEHARFLALARKKEVFVKLVCSEATAEADFLRAVELIAAEDKNVPLILQPVTSAGGCKAPSPEKLLFWQEAALRRLDDVRVIPQIHKFMNQL